jgi:hypothetical protein
MSLQQRHRCLLLGLLVLGCIGLALTTTAGEAQKKCGSWSGEGTVYAERIKNKEYSWIPVDWGKKSADFTVTFEVNELWNS